MSRPDEPQIRYCDVCDNEPAALDVDSEEGVYKACWDCFSRANGVSVCNRCGEAEATHVVDYVVGIQQEVCENCQDFILEAYS